MIAATSQQYPLRMAAMGVAAGVEYAKTGKKVSGYTDTGVTLIAAKPMAGVDSKGCEDRHRPVLGRQVRAVRKLFWRRCCVLPYYRTACDAAPSQNRLAEFASGSEKRLSESHLIRRTEPPCPRPLPNYRRWPRWGRSLR